MVEDGVEEEVGERRRLNRPGRKEFVDNRVKKVPGGLLQSNDDISKDIVIL